MCDANVQPQCISFKLCGDSIHGHNWDMQGQHTQHRTWYNLRASIYAPLHDEFLHQVTLVFLDSVQVCAEGPSHYLGSRRAGSADDAVDL